MNDVVVITGASSGIGESTALLAAKHGYSVAINYNKNETSAIEIKNKIELMGARTDIFQANVSCEAEVVQMFSEIEDKMGKIKALINNAGVTGGFAKVDEVKADQILDVLHTNVLGTLLCTREVIKRMKKYSASFLKGCSIINISSTVSKTGGANEWVHYAASKGAIDAYTNGLAKEIGALGIRANTVSPGLVRTNLHELNGDPDRPDRLEGSVPLKYVANPNEISEMIVWLLSENASYVSGAKIEVSGGR
ncbi:SDR family oxidoreductase [bacterium]|nr:SDR family oxidoreductase [bacterium]